MIRITLENITKSYGLGRKKTNVLQGIDLTIEPGEFFFLLGPSGCGKTTLLRIIAGLIDAGGGRLFFNQDDVTHRAVEKRDCAMVFQNYALWPHMTVEQNVQFGPRMQGRDAAFREQICREKLSLVRMQDYLKRKPNQLSGGQQQRVALARALAARTGCLLLDEPLSNLDARLRMQMRRELRELVKNTRVTAIYVTHDQKEALSMADRVAIMHEGRIIQLGTPGEIYNRPQTMFVADFVGEANFIEGTISRMNGTRQISTPAGPLETPLGESIKHGDRVTCCVRPERIKILGHAPVPPGANVLDMKVIRTTYLGEISQVHAALSTGQEWKITSIEKKDMAYGKGDPIRAAVAPEDVIPLTR